MPRQHLQQLKQLQQEQQEQSRRRKRPAPPASSTFSDESDGEAENKRAAAKRKLSRSICRPANMGRRLRADSDSDSQSIDLVHAAQIASLNDSNKYTPAFSGSSSEDEIVVTLQYPSALPRERYVFLFASSCQAR
jgi:hypothetical protein